jgi:hypothetical protein
VPEEKRTIIVLMVELLFENVNLKLLWKVST